MIFSFFQKWRFMNWFPDEKKKGVLAVWCNKLSHQTSWIMVLITITDESHPEVQELTMQVRGSIRSMGTPGV